MSDIKTKDLKPKSVKVLDKATAWTERVKNPIVYANEKSKDAVSGDGNIVDYGSDKIKYVSNRAKHESIYAAKKGECKPFSKQQLVDCDTTDSACNGGLMEYAFDYLKKIGCINLAEDYPYTGRKSTCKTDYNKCIDMTVTGYKKLGSSTSTWSPVDEDEVKEFL